MVNFENHGANDVLPSASTEVATLAGVGSDEGFRRKIRELVGSLRERAPGGLREVFAPVLAQRDQALANEISPGGAAVLAHYDRLIFTALSMRYDALDQALSRTSFAVAEIDGTGLISYANEALKAMLPDALGRDFASLFGPRSRNVSDALSSGKRETLQLDLHRGNVPSVHLRGEIGPLSDEHDRLGAYALLLGVEGELARFEALPDGILRLDPEGKVVFANSSAAQILGARRDDLRGRVAATLFSPDEPGSGPLPIEQWMQLPEAHRGVAVVAPLDGSALMPVRVTLAPSFDTAESRAGAILTIAPIAKEVVRADLQRLLSDPGCEPENLIRGVMQSVQRVMPYDLATFGVYTDDMTHHHTLVVHPVPGWTWTTAWFPVGEEARAFLLGTETWGANLQEATKVLAPYLEDDDVLKHLLESGMKGFVTLPISGGGRRVRASMTLLSTQEGRYNGPEIDLMRELGVEKALLVAEANILRRREDRIRALEAQLTAASDYRQLARALAEGVAECFGWDYVAVFEVDRRASCFRLVKQCNRTGYRDVDPAYSQPLTEGLLGTALRDNAPRAEDNIEARSQYGYKPIVPGRRSAIAMPVRVIRQAVKPISDEIEWMLCIESSQRNAFQGPDMVSLDELLTQCEGILRQRWQNAVQSSLLDAVEQAVVLVDRAGRVRLTNQWANTLFHSQGTLLLGRMLSDFGAEEIDNRMLGSASPIAQARLTLRVGNVIKVPTLASQRELCDDYGHRLWLFTDLREQEEHSNWGYLEQTVNEVAQNARLPLMLAGSLVRNAKQLLREPNIAMMLESAVRQLGKADITYERLASALAVRREPDSPPQIFDPINLLWKVVGDLPEDDILQCELPEVDIEATRSFLIIGWPEQLSFAFRSLLGYLLVRRPVESKVRITLQIAHDGILMIILSVPTGATFEQALSTPTDRIAVAEQRAGEAASLASEAVELAIRRHNGEFFIDTQDRSALAFRIELPPME